MMRRILVTGMSGPIGGAVRKQLASRNELSALNPRRVEGVETYQADISDFDAILPAFKGKEVVIHLAAILHKDLPWEDQLRCNIIGTLNVFERHDAQASNESFTPVAEQLC
jgi:nucleoside-diphosphate-sugar epimerase